MEFNPDGSLKIGGAAGKKIAEDAFKMSTSRCIRVTRDTTRSTSPKSCTVTIELSELIEKDIVSKSFGFFSKRVQSTVKLNKIDASEYQVIIGPEFSRCNDCQNFVGTLREYLNGNVIERRGSCAWKNRPDL